MTVSEYLLSFGLEQYTTVFEENDLDYSTLRDLTDSDLKELGLTNFVHRKKILANVNWSAATAAESEQELQVNSDERNDVTKALDEGKLYYSNHGITITNLDIQIGGKKTIPLDKIQGMHNFGHIHPEQSQKIAVGFASLLMGISISIVIMQITWLGMSISLGIPMILGGMGFLLAEDKPQTTLYYFKLTVNNEEMDAYVSGEANVKNGNKMLVDEMVEALNKAIVENIK